jgi:glucan phosphoethanolaminetransferase (alkaline phosphatase superfamily)
MASKGSLITRKTLFLCVLSVFFFCSTIYISLFHDKQFLMLPFQILEAVFRYYSQWGVSRFKVELVYWPVFWALILQMSIILYRSLNSLKTRFSQSR